MKLWISAFFLFALCGSSQATTSVWQPTTGHVQVPIWPGTPPDAQPAPGPEKVTVSKNLVADQPWHAITNVIKPTMTVYPPRGANTGAAVVVFPGGGFQVLAIDLEGTEACHWLTSSGITCVLLKYRVPGKPYSWKCRCYPQGVTVLSLPSLQDAQRTIRLIRAHAKKWHINPNKIGVLGFSAGGYLVAETSSNFNHQYYKPVDKSDRVSDRPDFAIAIYPGHVVALEHAASRYGVPESLVYYTALAKAGVPAELHIYAKGGHAFGLRPTKFPITRWPKLATTWLHTIGILKGK